MQGLARGWPWGPAALYGAARCLCLRGSREGERRGTLLGKGYPLQTPSPGASGSHPDVTATHTLCPAVPAVELRNPARAQQAKLQLGEGAASLSLASGYCPDISPAGLACGRGRAEGQAAPAKRPYAGSRSVGLCLGEELNSPVQQASVSCGTSPDTVDTRMGHQIPCERGTGETCGWGAEGAAEG